jgi:LPXTG-motif cell wall-anchored protein
MNTTTRTYVFSLSVAVILSFISVTVGAQVKTSSSTSSGQPTTQTQVERGEVVSVNGNDLVVKMEDGSLRHFANVPESARVTVDGQELGIHDLKPGMKLQRTITTTTVPKTITTVQTVSGTVWQVSPPNYVTLRLQDGTTQRFKIPQGQKFTVDGQQTDAFGLRQGMNVSATKIVEVPETVVEHQRKVTGTMPPPPAPPASDQPILIAVLAAPTPAPAPSSSASEQPQTPAASEQPKTLPKTGSSIPLLGLLGALALATGLTLRVARLIRKA